MVVLKDFQAKTAYMAHWFLALCFFALTISVSVTTISYLLVFALILFSGSRVFNWQDLKNNKGALSFWLLLLLFLIGIVGTTSTLHLAWQDLHKRHWLLVTPFIVLLIKEEKWRKRIINAFLISMIITLIVSYIKVLTSINIYSYLPSFINSQGSDGSVFVNYINQSLAMSVAAFICGCRCLFENKKRLLYGAIYFFMAVNVLFMSHGRTGYGIFILLFAYLLFVRFGWKGFFVAVFFGVIMLGVAYKVSRPFENRINMMFVNSQKYYQHKQNSSIGQRIEMISIAKKMIKARPWFGYGTGGIRTALPSVIPANERVLNPSLDYVENIYLNFLLEFGVFGLLVLLVAIGMQIKTSFALPNQYRYLFQAVLIAILFGGCFNSFFVSFIPAHLYALFSALCLSALPTRVKSI